jgi:hypothetical protein
VRLGIAGVPAHFVTSRVNGNCVLWIAFHLILSLSAEGLSPASYIRFHSAKAQL